MHVCMYVCMYMCAFVYVCLCVFVYLCMCVCRQLYLKNGLGRLKAHLKVLSEHRFHVEGSVLSDGGWLLGVKVTLKCLFGFVFFQRFRIHRCHTQPPFLYPPPPPPRPTYPHMHTHPQGLAR